MCGSMTSHTWPGRDVSQLPSVPINSLGPTIEIFPRMPGPNISRACSGIAQLGERRQRRTPAGSVGRLVRYRCRSTLIAAVWLTWKVTPRKAHSSLTLCQCVCVCVCPCLCGCGAVCMWSIVLNCCGLLGV